jgi:hypothetical protein
MDDGIFWAGSRNVTNLGVADHTESGMALGALAYCSVCLDWSDGPVKPSHVSQVARSNRSRLRGAESVITWIESEVERTTGAPLPPVMSSQSGSVRLQTLVGPRDLLSPIYRRITVMLWAAWFAEYGVLYTFQTFVSTILSTKGYSIVKSLRYSVVIYGAVIPGYILGGQVVEWLDLAARQFHTDRVLFPR